MRCSQAIEDTEAPIPGDSLLLIDSEGQTLVSGSSPPLGNGKPLHMYLGRVGLTQQLSFVSAGAIYCPDTRGVLEVHPHVTLGKPPMKTFSI